MEYKIVQSFWGKPTYNPDGFSSRLQGGWLAERYHYYSWAFSCLQLRQHYKEVELVTDAIGKSILIDKLKLPYTNVVVALDTLNHYDPDLWAIGKLYTYSLQDRPFIHVDGDVFIWDRIEATISDQGLIAQNAEESYDSYSSSMREVYANFTYIPEVLAGTEYRHGRYPALNAGMIGGCNIDFIQLYVREAFDFVNKNAMHFGKINLGMFNAVYEQLLLAALAGRANQEIGFLFPDVSFMPTKNASFKYFNDRPGYIHTLGAYKKNKSSYQFMEYYLRTLYPSYYHHINELIYALEV